MTGLTKHGRSAKRTKTLEVTPIHDGLVSFRLSLEDRSTSTEGEELIHSLTLEGQISLPDLVIQSIEPHAIQQPYAECAASLAPVRQLVGTRIGAGFRDRVLRLMGRTRGCTHFLTMALDLSAAHTLSLFLRMRAREPFEARNGQDDLWTAAGLDIEPRLENACVALQTASPVLKRARRGKR